MVMDIVSHARTRAPGTKEYSLLRRLRGCHFAGLLHAVNFMISGDSGEDGFEEMVKDEEEYRLGNIMPMDQVREKVKKIIAKEGYYCRS